jgi:hypothetical protein
MSTPHRKIYLVARLLVLAALLAITASFILTPEKKATARVCHEVEHYYYSDATYTVEVGEKFFYCNGTYSWGTVTAYDFVIDGGSCCTCGDC